MLSGDPVKSVVRQPEAKSIWIWISVLLAVGWITSITAWWFIRNGASWRRSEPPDSLEISLRKAKNRLNRACTGNNAREARSALLGWANATVVIHKFDNLNQVTRYFGNPLKQQVDRLNQCIYGTPGDDISTDDWNGEMLWKICQQISAELMPLVETRSSRGLHPLNP